MKKHEEEQFLCVFIQHVWTSVARLESLVFPEAVSCGFEKESLKRWSFEWLGDFRSIALRRKNFYRWRCPWYHFANLRLHFQFSNIPVHLRFEISSSLDVLWSCGNGNSSEHTCIHGAANMLPCQLQACMLLANWGQWRAAHILCELLSHFRILWNWFRVWLNYGRCRYGLRSLCWAMRWLHTIQAYNIGGCWWQLVLFLHEERSKIGDTFLV